MKRRLFVLAILLWPSVAFAHEVRPAYLQIHQTGPDSYAVLWKVPGRGDGMRLGLYVELPADCVRLAGRTSCAKATEGQSKIARTRSRRFTAPSPNVVRSPLP